MDFELATAVVSYVALRVAVFASVAGALFYISRQNCQLTRLPVLERLIDNAGTRRSLR